VGRRSADFLDHHAADLCVEDLRRLAESDPIPSVRRAAVHALGCAACKPQSLATDVTDFLARVVMDRFESAKVRGAAVWVLKQQTDSSRVIPPLRFVLDSEPDSWLRKSAHRVLRLHDAEYRRLTDARARHASGLRQEGAAGLPPAPLPRGV